MKASRMLNIEHRRDRDRLAYYEFSFNFDKFNGKQNNIDILDLLNYCYSGFFVPYIFTPKYNHKLNVNLLSDQFMVHPGCGYAFTLCCKDYKCILGNKNTVSDTKTRMLVLTGH